MRSPFVPSFLSEPFVNAYDPLVFHADHFADGQYRVLTMVPSTAFTLRKTADFTTFTTVAADWHPAITKDGDNTFQDHVVLTDGTIVLYQNDGTEEATAVWTGTAADLDAGTMTRQGQVLATEGDCGTYYDTDTDTVHIFTQDADNPYGAASSSVISHWTTPGDDLLNATQQANAVDTGGLWGTGDPCVFEMFGCYWMFCDYTVSHPTYWVALARSDDLTTWEIIDPRFTADTGIRGADFDVVDTGDHLIALSEFTGADILGVGVWQLDKRPARSFQSHNPTVGGSTLTASLGGSARPVRAWPH